VTANTSYTYQVQAIDAAGNLSPLSDTASATTPVTADTTPPTAPSDLAAEEVTSNQIDLGWTASTDSGTGVSGYRCTARGPASRPSPLLATAAGTGPGDTSYQDLTVKPTSAYQYYVTAYDGASNESAASNPLPVTTPAGPPYKSFTFAAGEDATIDQANATTNTRSSTTLIADNSPVDDFLLRFNLATSGCTSLTTASLRLTNNANGSAHGGDLYTTGPNWTERTVTWASAPTRGTLLNSLGAVAANSVASVDVTHGITTLNGEVSFRIGSPVNDGVRYWSKKAANAANRPLLTVVCATSAPAPGTTAPTAPANLTGQAPSSREIDLQWTASTDNVEVTGYNIYRGDLKVGAVSGDALTYQDTSGLKPNTSYSYRVTAVDAAGNESAKSNTVTLTTPGATGSKSFSFGAAADATIDATNASTNAGAATKLVVDNSPVDDFVIKFTVAATGCTTVHRATLQLTNNANGSVKGSDFYATDPSWDERTVTWANAPIRGKFPGSLGAMSAGATYGVDVTTGLSTLNGEVAFRVRSTPGDGAHYYSKEGGTTAVKPQLTVVCS
jgi:fibronectin type 3 domain-containing protein